MFIYISDETGGLVLDVGFSTVKFGFAGEDMPKLVFPSVCAAVLMLPAHPHC
jgi:actin-related protein